MAFFIFLFALFLCFFLSIGVGMLMRKWGVVDRPKALARKIHKKPIPLGGGVAIYATVFLLLGVLYTTGLIGVQVGMKEILALFCGGTILMIGGLIDDKFPLSPLKQLVGPFLASLIVIFIGVKPLDIATPFGSTISFGSVISGIIVFVWLMVTMYTTKLLDGLDGLVSGIVAIGALVIFFLTRQTLWFQPEVGYVALVFGGASLGFLLLNWHPAKLFLGEGGSLFAGFMLGSLAIISGSKIATTLLVMGVPMLDVVRVIIRRIQLKKSIFVGDNEHLHFKLLQSGLSQKQTVLLFYTVALLCGLTGLFVQSSQKIIALLFLVVLMVLLGVWFTIKDSNN